MVASSARTFSLNSLSNLELHNVSAQPLTYLGRPALRLIEQDGPMHGLAILSASNFTDGVIEVDVAGAPQKDAPQAMRGFVGIAFRVQPNAERFECFYLRPTNGRADDQLRRNHATQYISHPHFPWHRLREETPGVYESYADLVPGAWISVKIVVAGTRAELYIHGADQPCLVVNDLKLSDTNGQIALWAGPGTQAHFSALTVK